MHRPLRIHCRCRRVFSRARNQFAETVRPAPEPLACKLIIKPDSVFYSWLASELGRRMGYDWGQYSIRQFKSTCIRHQPWL